MALSFTREQRMRAVTHKLPLGSIGVDDRHLSKADGGKYGMFHYQGVIPPQFAKRMLKLLTEICQANNAAKTPIKRTVKRLPVSKVRR